MRWLWLSLLLVDAVAASEIEKANLSYKRGAYNYEFTVLIDGAADTVRAIVTDYDHLKRLSDDIVESVLIERFDERNLKRRMWLNYCVLIFCFDLVFVEHVELKDNGDIIAEIIPEESNFHWGKTIWRLEAVGDHQTRITVVAEQSPKFWVPPIIGPIIMKSTFLKEVRKTCENIEALARAQYVQP